MVALSAFRAFADAGDNYELRQSIGMDTGTGSSKSYGERTPLNNEELDVHVGLWE
jgi:hypothetical protein